MRNRNSFFVIFVVFLGCGLFTANRLPPLALNSASAVGPASGASSNVIGAVGQQVSLFVPAGGAVRLNVSGTFTGTISFKLSQDGGSTYSAVNCINTSTGSFTDQSTTATGSWLYLPTSGNSGTLQVSATAWTSGAAIVDMIDLVANPANVDLVLLTSSARTTQQTLNAIPNGLWSGLIIYLNVTVASGTGGLQVQLQVQEPVSGSWFQPSAAQFPAGSTKVTATGFNYYVLMPTGQGGIGTVGLAARLPDTFRLLVTVGDASSYTYTLSCSLLK